MGGKTIIGQLKEYKKKLSEKIDIEELILFGSRAKGQGSEDSDIDLLVVSKDFENVRFFKRPVALYKQWDMDYSADILCYTPDEIEKKRKIKWGIVAIALAEGTRV